MLTAVRINWGEHKHSAPRPTGTAWELQKQHHGKGTNKVWGRDRWTGVSCTKKVTGWASSNGWGKASGPKGRQTWIYMAANRRGNTLGSTQAWAGLLLRRESKVQGEERVVRVGLGNRTKIQGLKTILFISEKNAKAAFNCALHQRQEGTPKCPQTAEKLLKLFLIPSQRRD